jgi:hypothetical protein
VATAIAAGGAAALVAIDRQAVDTLYVHRIAKSEAPLIDGDASNPVWRSARMVKEALSFTDIGTGL